MGSDPTLDLREVTPAIGAEVRSIDLRSPVSATTRRALRAALLTHHVLFFRDQELGPLDQVALCELFGPVVGSIGVRTTDAQTDTPGVTVLDQVAPKGQGADIWHSDHMFMQDTPLGTCLRAVQVPDAGGDTCFASLHAVHDGLSDRLRALVRHLTAVNSNGPTVDRVRSLAVYENDFDREPIRKATHPLVRPHPETRRLGLFFSPRDTVRVNELSEDESDALLALLGRRVDAPEVQCRFSWEPGSIALWDNRSVLHRGVPDYHQRRVMHRTLIGS